ncbi:MAG: hypothetical protein H6722_18930 [Sandaracinus sp.]|nr:hypothetical protein [Sandaracinus sp.]MCB9614518.1 hypothetical protein [Sandaracinus sp.]MCB9620989.1 hypothetical protein [Sandaracinus sp.]MCB9622923.1 hypothetical protein [Sandaracinus sp.]
MSRVTRSDFATALHEAPIDPQRLEADPRTAGLGLESADRDGDGRIADRELDRVFEALDRLDGRRDGTITTRARNGVAGDVLAGVLASAGRRGDTDAPDGALVLVGLTDASRTEAARLRERGAVRYVGDSTRGNVAVDGKGVLRDLSTEEHRAAFVRSLGLPDSVAEQVRDVLERADPSVHRELAGLAREWAGAYRGRAIPNRLMVSGHGNGVLFFEQNQDELRADDLLGLARAMPRAARQIRHVHLAACQHGYESRMQPYVEAFPNLESLWGYAGFSPSGAPAHEHQARWDVDTREGLPDRGRVRGLRRDASAAVWTRTRGWEGTSLRPLPELHERATAAMATLDAIREGRRPPGDPTRGPLAELYGTLQELTAHHDFRDQDADFRRVWLGRRDQVLRLRFFESHVTHAFERTHGTTLSAACHRLGIEPLRLAGSTRAEVLSEITRFEAAADSHPDVDVSVALDLLDRGLRKLDSDLVPPRWL